MMRWKSSPNAGIARSSRSKLRSMEILFGLLNFLGISQSGESILSRASGSFRFLFVTINTFTKWMEAMQVVNITQDSLVKFLQSIMYMFDVPKLVLTDNGTEFKGAKFTRCCSDFGIHYQASLVAHTQTNGQVERVNRLIL
jgi:hypothetical protein